MIFDFSDNKPATEAIRASKIFNEQERVTFITGEAGSGKTELLRKICDDYDKEGTKYLITAPTGVAAINCEGVTLHSAFRLPIGMNPNAPLNLKPLYEDRDKKIIELLRNIDVLIIDEISMVSAYMLDLISKRLCQVKKKTYKSPFGGIKVIMIGDLLQLPPVIGNKDHNIYYKYYPSPWFFAASCMKEITPRTILLSRNYRQENDKDYQKLLASIRAQKNLDTIVSGINKHCITSKKMTQSSNTILCSTNKLCLKHNMDKLKEVAGREIDLHGERSGKFPESMMPVDEIITIKEGCKVMLCKNVYEEGILVASNGDICTVEEYDSSAEVLHLRKVRDNQVFECEQNVWENYEFVAVDSNIVEKKVVGFFEQFPIKLGYAVTIHKSQGITLDEAFIDIDYAFAPGLFYVALTRCRTFGGIQLNKTVKKEDLRMDEGILQIYADIEHKNAMFEEGPINDSKEGTSS